MSSSSKTMAAVCVLLLAVTIFNSASVQGCGATDDKCDANNPCCSPRVCNKKGGTTCCWPSGQATTKDSNCCSGQRKGGVCT